MKLLSDLVAHIKSLEAYSLQLAGELGKTLDHYEGSASADGAAKAKAVKDKLTKAVTDLHAQADKTVNEAEVHLANIAAGGSAAPATADPAVPVTMRAKMLVTDIRSFESSSGEAVCDVLSLVAVGGDKVQHGYPGDGSDEDNTFAKFSPSGNLELTVANPALLGKIITGEKYYLDFTLANPAPAAAIPASPAEPAQSASSQPPVAEQAPPAVPAVATPAAIPTTPAATAAPAQTTQPVQPVSGAN